MTNATDTEEKMKGCFTLLYENKLNLNEMGKFSEKTQSTECKSIGKFRIYACVYRYIHEIKFIIKNLLHAQQHTYF